MHVCHFCDCTFETDFFKTLVTGLSHHGVQISLIELGPGTPPTWLSEVRGAKYLSLNSTNKLSHLLAVRRVALLLKEQNVDILHTHLFFPGLIGVLTKRLLGKTQIAMMRHHTSVVRMLGSRLHIAADKWMAEKADHVMTVSQAARDYMRDVDGIERDDIEVVYTGFDFEKLAPNAAERSRVRLEFGFEADDLVIGYIGSFAPGKGQLQLIRAFAQISAAIPRARLFLVGRGITPEIRDEIGKFPEGKITLAGWRDDIAACLNAMDLFVQPSLSEAFSQVLIEAMGVGLPVIATDVGGAKEVIEDGTNGILIEPGDPEQIANAAVKMCRDRELRKSIGTAGRLNVTKRFTASQMVERQMLLYKRWLDRY